MTVCTKKTIMYVTCWLTYTINNGIVEAVGDSDAQVSVLNYLFNIIFFEINKTIYMIEESERHKEYSQSKKTI